MVIKKIAIILARGGSKRIPRKNLIDLGGKPMIAWTIEATLASQKFDIVLVSTDDEEIADIGRVHGAQVPFLRKTAADDLSPTSQATCTALIQAEDYWQTRFDVVAQLMANCPLRTSKDICAACDAFDNSGKESQISCFQFGWMNPWWAVKLNKEGIPESIFPEALKIRSQDLPPLFCPTGAIWIAKRDALVANGTFYLPGHRFEPMPWISAVDIDDEEDLRMAKLCMEFNRSVL